jgi:hypothetical protein
MNNELKKTLSLSNQGDHHLAKAVYDPATGQISLGGIYSFSNNSAASVQVQNGRTTGEFIHSGDTHQFKIDVNDDGTFDGAYVDTKNGTVKIEIQGGLARLSEGEIPVNGLKVTSDHHTVNLALDSNKKLSGYIESRDPDQGAYKLSFSDGKVTGSFEHAGDGHEISLELSSDGSYKASVSAGLGDSKLSFSVENGQAGVTTFAGMKMNF